MADDVPLEWDLFMIIVFQLFFPTKSIEMHVWCIIVGGVVSILLYNHLINDPQKNEPIDLYYLIKYIKLSLGKYLINHISGSWKISCRHFHYYHITFGVVYYYNSELKKIFPPIILVCGTGPCYKSSSLMIFVLYQLAKCYKL